MPFQILVLFSIEIFGQCRRQRSAPAPPVPSAPPLESLRDTYSVGASGNFEDHGAAPSEGGWGGVHAGEQQVQGSFYSPQEVQVLQAQAVPVDPFQLGKGGAAPSAEQRRESGGASAMGRAFRDKPTANATSGKHSKL